MSSILNYTCVNNIQTLFYTFEHSRNIDDIAMHLLNEIPEGGFLPSRINRDVSHVEFEMDKMIPCLNEAVFSKPEDLYCIFLDLKNALDVIRRYGIDERYMVHDVNAVYRNSESGETFFAVLPCVEILNQQRSREEFIISLISEAQQRNMIDDDTASELNRCVLQTAEDDSLPEKLTVMMTERFPQCREIMREHLEVEDVTLSESMVREDAIEENAEEAVTETAPSEETVVETAASEETEIPVEILVEETEETVDQQDAVVDKTGNADENVVSEEVKQEAASVKEEILNDEEWMNQLREAIRNELLTEKQKTRNAYLLRNSNGEIFSLADDIFIIGKASRYCDYVIADNPAISKLHAIIRYDEEKDTYFIVDCDSTNHTYLNGKMIPSEQAVELENQMVIHLGSEAFVFRR